MLDRTTYHECVSQLKNCYTIVSIFLVIMENKQDSQHFVYESYFLRLWMSFHGFAGGLISDWAICYLHFSTI